MREQKQKLSFAFTLLAVLGAGCGIYETKNQPGNLNELSTLGSSGSRISFAQVNEAIIQPNCARCHRDGNAKGDVLLDTYANVKANLDGLLDQAVVKGEMPPSGPLPAQQREILRTWIEQGAPEVASAQPLPPTASATPIAPVNPPPTPTATPEPVATATPVPSATPELVATYTSIRDLIFAPSCIGCHRAGSARAGVQLDTFDAVKANLAAIKTTAVERGSMPPRAPLSDAQRAVLKLWIEAGAINNEAAVPTPTPLATPTPSVTPVPSATPAPALVPTYASIREQVFKVKCLLCHAAGARAEDFPLDDYDKMIAEGTMIKPGDLAGSGIIEPMESMSMPPKRSQLPPVTAEELAAIKIWIINGAKP